MIALILLAASAGLAGLWPRGDQMTRITHALESVGATVDEIQFDGWADWRGDTVADTPSALSAAGQRVAAALGLGQLTWSERDGDHFRRSNASHADEKFVLEIDVQFHDTPGQSVIPNRFVMVHWRGRPSASAGGPTRSSLMKAIRTAFPEPTLDEPTVYVTVTGVIEGMLNADERDQLVSRTLEALGGRLRERSADTTFLSVTGYVPRLAKPTSIDGQDVNVQIAVHVDEILGVTYLIIGTPLVPVEY